MGNYRDKKILLTCAREGCETTFHPWHDQPTKYCGTPCALMVNRAARRGFIPLEERPCLGCGVPFTPSSQKRRNQQYHSIACGAKWARIRLREAEEEREPVVEEPQSNPPVQPVIILGANWGVQVLRGEES